MNKQRISGKWIFSGEYLEIETEDGVVTSVSAADPGDLLLCPGFFDIQLNGYAGVDYSADFSAGDLETLTGKLIAGGTTRHLPTIITNSEQRILKSIRDIQAARKSSSFIREAIPGIHIEGPFISAKDGARGVHDPAHIRAADYDEYLRWQKAAEGLVRIVTLSPEDENAISFIRKITADGVIAAIGHTDASPEMIHRAADAGARLSTHLGNGSPFMLPRLKNFIWSQLADDRLAASFIADGFHLPGDVLRCITRCKNRDDAILVSDAAALAGSPPGLYKWGNVEVEVHKNGQMNLHGTSSLAGAAHLLDTCVAVLRRSTELPLAECVRFAAVNPGRLLGCGPSETIPRAGDAANLLSFRPGQDKIMAEQVIFNQYNYSRKATGDKT